MKLSDKKRSEVYESIAEPIMQLRLQIQKHGAPSSDMLDAQLFGLQNEIWIAVHKAIKLDGTA